ncbi:MAG: NADH:flavin oxidoreductase [Candidatus Aquicultor sp.]
MSILFTPMRIGELQIKNRFVHSATHEGMTTESGEVTDKLIRRYQTLARGEVGLIIPGFLYVHPSGRTFTSQAGIHSDDLIPGLRRLVEAVHQEGGKIAFQLVHAGRQTTKSIIGRTPMGPSAGGRDPVNLVKPREMTEEDIQETIAAFGSAAGRAVEAGVDAIQFHAHGGYLLNQFLSPFFNRRTDKWGGSDENRFRFLKEVFLEVKKAVPAELPILIKLGTNDHTPQPGITPTLAVVYARWLAELGVDGVEVSCGTMSYSFMNVLQGEVPIEELAMGFPRWKRPFVRQMGKRLAGNYDLQEGFNLEAAKMIKPVLGDIPLFIVGGMRRAAP